MNPSPVMNPDMQLLLPLLSKAVGHPDKYKVALEMLCTALMSAPRELGAVMLTLKRLGKIPDWDLAMSLMGPHIDLAAPQVVRIPAAEPATVPTVEVEDPSDNTPRVTRERAPRVATATKANSAGDEVLQDLTPVSVSACGETAEVDAWKDAYKALMGMLLRAGIYDTIPKSWFRDGPANNGLKHQVQIEGRWVYTNLSRADQAARIKTIATLTDTLKVRVLDGDVEREVVFA